MHTPLLYSEVTAALEAAVEPDFQSKQQHFFKEGIRSLGVRTAAMRGVAKAFFPQVKGLPWEAFWAECEALLDGGLEEQRGVAFCWAFSRRRGLLPEHYDVLFGWLERYVTNWAACDQLCCEVFGEFMVRYPQFVTRVTDWARSDNRWLRRAAAVVLIPGLRQSPQFLPQIFAVAQLLIADQDDLVQKGYGWTLKEGMERYQEETLPFVMAHRHEMPRTALRYAVEKLSPELRAAALKS